MFLCKWFGWWCATAPIQAPVIPPEPKQPVVEVPSKPVQEKKELIEQIVKESSCKNVSWKDRGVAKPSYIIGMAHTFAQAKCDKRFFALATAPHSKHKNREGYFGDVMYHYGIAPTLPNVFTLLMGLGMRESSGRHCCGRDMSAGFASAENAEAGVWQTSYNAISMDPYLKEIFTSWVNECHLPEYSKDVTCSKADWKYWGTGANGLSFQWKAKNCPSFHAHFTVITMRRNKDHFGPFWHTRKVAEFQKPCLAMFEKIDSVIQCE